ncbi:MAG: hypothetical protein QE285_07760 [Aquabacterium sp.]|nr:hypothetical protein [Aquabacterium sp.]
MVAAADRSTTAGEAANTAVTVALGAAALRSSATSSFWRGLALGRMAGALVESTEVSLDVRAEVSKTP